MFSGWIRNQRAPTQPATTVVVVWSASAQARSSRPCCEPMTSTNRSIGCWMNGSRENPTITSNAPPILWFSANEPGHGTQAPAAAAKKIGTWMSWAGAGCCSLARLLRVRLRRGLLLRVRLRRGLLLRVRLRSLVTLVGGRFRVGLAAGLSVGGWCCDEQRDAEQGARDGDKAAAKVREDETDLHPR